MLSYLKHLAFFADIFLQFSGYCVPSLNKGGQVDVVKIDFSMEFDRVSFAII